MQLFDFLTGLSPWWWVAFALALGAFEMATMSFFLIWPGLAALLVAALIWLAPELSGSTQVIAFAALSVALTFVGRYLMNRFGDGGDTNNTLNSRAEMMVGRHAKVLDYAGPEGHVSIDGIRWRALWPANSIASDGDTVRVSGSDGMTLLIASSKISA